MPGLDEAARNIGNASSSEGEHSPVFADAIARVSEVEDFARLFEEQLEETQALSLTFAEALAVALSYGRSMVGSQ